MKNDYIPLLLWVSQLYYQTGWFIGMTVSLKGNGAIINAISSSCALSADKPKVLLWKRSAAFKNFLPYGFLVCRIYEVSQIDKNGIKLLTCRRE